MGIDEYKEANGNSKFSFRLKTKNQTSDNVNNLIHKNVKSIINSSLKVEKIVGIADNGGELLFQIKFRNIFIPKLVPAWFANSKFTDKFVDFNEQRIKWHCKAYSINMKTNR